MANSIKLIEREMNCEEAKKQVQEKYEEIVPFLNEVRPNYQSLGCGYHKGRYYFGTKLWKDGRGYDAVITDEPYVYLNTLRKTDDGWEGENQIKKAFGLNYKEGFYHEALDNIFTGKAINRYLEGDISDITLQLVFDKLTKAFKKYVFLENETKYKILALYRIAGFFLPVWNTRARLFFHAEFGSGKSRSTTILHNTGFNSISLGDWTLPFLQRIIQSTRSETHIDDFESLDTEKQQATIRQVKVGYLKGFKAGKIQDRTRRPEVFDLFNTTTLNNTLGLDFISNDRCITIRIPKIASKEYDTEPDFKEPLWQELRDELYILGLKEAKKVAETYPTVNSEKLNGRLLSIIKPELTLAKLISDDLFLEIENWWKEEIQQRGYKELTDDWEFLGLEKIYQIVVIRGNEDFFILLDDVVLPVIEKNYGVTEIPNLKRKMSTMLGNMLSVSPYFKKRVVNGKTQYRVSKKDLLVLLEAKNILSYIIDYGSTSPTTSITSISSTTPTKNKVEGVGVVGVVEPKVALYNKKDVLQLIKKQGSLSIETLFNRTKSKIRLYEWLEWLQNEGQIIRSEGGEWKAV